MFLSCFFSCNYIAEAVATVISIRLSQGVKITWIALFSKHHDLKTHTCLIQFVSLLKDSAAECSLITPVVDIMLTWLLALGTIRYDKFELHTCSLIPYEANVM